MRRVAAWVWLLASLGVIAGCTKAGRPSSVSSTVSSRSTNSVVVSVTPTGSPLPSNAAAALSLPAPVTPAPSSAGREVRPEHRSTTVLFRGKLVDGSQAPLVESGADLYLVSGHDLTRVSTRTGRVLGLAHLAGGAGPLVVADHLVWAVTVNRGEVRVSRFTPALRALGTVSIHSGASNATSLSAAATPDGHAFFVSDGQRVVRVNTDRSELAPLNMHFPAPVSGIAVSPGGHGKTARLYVASGRAFHGVIDAFTVNGSALKPLFGASVGDSGNIDDTGGLAASDGGVWFAAGVGMTSSVSFVSRDGHTSAGVVVSNFGGTTVMVSQNTAWMITEDAITCADGSTGHAEAAIITRPRPERALTVSAYRSRVYAIYHRTDRNTTTLVKMTEPRFC